MKTRVERERRQKRRINIYRKTAEQREGGKRTKREYFFTYALSRHRRPHPRALVILGRVNADLCCGALTQLFDGSSLAFALRFLLGNADAGVVGNRARRPTVQRRDANHPKQSWVAAVVPLGGGGRASRRSGAGDFLPPIAIKKRRGDLLDIKTLNAMITRRGWGGPSEGVGGGRGRRAGRAGRGR